MFQTTLAVPPEGAHDRLLQVASAAAVLRTYRSLWTEGRWEFTPADEPPGCVVDVPHHHLHATNPTAASDERAQQVTPWRGMTEVGRAALVAPRRGRRWLAAWLLKQQGADLEGPLARFLGVRVVYTLDGFYLCPVCEQWVLLAGPEHVETFIG